MAIVKFQGKQYKFPDNATQEQIEGVLRSEARPVQLERSFEDRQATTVSAGPSPIKLDPNTKIFVDAIRQVETGTLKNKFIRTNKYGSNSSAYGPYQITGGLLETTVKSHPSLFDKDEHEAIQDLMQRQRIALTIGGKDRAKYEKAGTPAHGRAAVWAGQYGYSSVDAFLSDFDYGGSLGLKDNYRFQSLYENVARKLLVKTLADADGDMREAAARWHGGANWATGKHRQQTDDYLVKVQPHLM